ncbi:hypothetical protein RND81_08G150800 [Saponaria officinalis]|uniref:HRDC domain-containing protein n=1 Tax=Saponaria officinalis TaxID=3572 RepID=A0AAW1J6Y5_SAPOF
MSNTTSNIPFHLPNLPKPQDVYGIRPDNSNKASVRPELPPELTRYFAHDFVDKPVPPENHTDIQPKPLESTQLTYIDTLDGLKVLRSKLCVVDEFGVDLEANNYRSFQGITCLMQISTRTEDFVVDTLKLHHSIRYYLGSVFLDPTKRKVMHGAGNDILWLQRDFGIYVCNLFDTMQASRVLKLDRNSLQYLLIYFCGVLANKQYQTSDWRIRPLPRDMLHYAREDTHYLLYIYDKMRSRLVSGAGRRLYDFDDPLLEVYSRSHKICTVIYEKEVFNDESYKNIFGLDEVGLNPTQMNVVAKMYKWRDELGRQKDESTGYVMPNKLLLEICEKMPKSKSELMSICDAHQRQNHPLIEKNIAQLMKIIGVSELKSKVSDVQHRQSGSEIEAEIQYQIKRPRGYFVTSAVYPQACYISAIHPPPVYCVPARRPLVMSPIYCTYPNYYKYQIC